MPQLQVFPQAPDKRVCHQALGPLLQPPAPSLLSGVAYATPETPVLQRVPECYPCLKSLQKAMTWPFIVLPDVLSVRFAPLILVPGSKSPCPPYYIERVGLSRPIESRLRGTTPRRPCRRNPGPHLHHSPVWVSHLGRSGRLPASSIFEVST